MSRFEKNYQLALKYTTTAIEVLKEAFGKNPLKLKKLLPPFERELADVLIKLGKLEEAENILMESWENVKESGDEFTKGHLALTFFTLYLKDRLEKAGKIGHSYIAKKERLKKF